VGGNRIHTLLCNEESKDEIGHILTPDARPSNFVGAPQVLSRCHLRD
jgi:hypothetical protein